MVEGLQKSLLDDNLTSHWVLGTYLRDLLKGVTQLNLKGNRTDYQNPRFLQRRLAVRLKLSHFDSKYQGLVVSSIVFESRPILSQRTSWKQEKQLMLIIDAYLCKFGG